MISWQSFSLVGVDTVLDFLSYWAPLGPSPAFHKLIATGYHPTGAPSFNVLLRKELLSPDDTTWILQSIAPPSAFPQDWNPGLGVSSPPPTVVTSPPQWHCTTLVGPYDLLSFLNYGTALFQPPEHFLLAASRTLERKEVFFVFHYQSTSSIETALIEPTQKWSHTIAYSPDEATAKLGYFNKQRSSRATVVSTHTAGTDVLFHVVTRTKSTNQPHINWRPLYFVSLQSCIDFLNCADIHVGVSRQITQTPIYNYPPPPYDIKSICDIGIGYVIFVPDSIVVLCRTELKDGFGDYTKWQLGRGIETYVICVDEALKHDNLEGTELRFRVRNIIRDLHYARSTRYALLVGDAQVGDLESWNPVLYEFSTKFDMPIDYYSIYKSGVFLQWRPTTCFYCDTASKVDYDVDESWHFAGDYRIAAGVLPVRDLYSLNRVLQKTMKCTPSKKLVHIKTAEFMQTAEQIASADSLKAATVNGGVDYERHVIAVRSDDCKRIRKMFRDASGVVWLDAHGTGSTGIDLGKCTLQFGAYDDNAFADIQPGWVGIGCTNMIYFLAMPPLGFVENLLINKGGPASVADDPLDNEKFLGLLCASSAVGDAMRLSSWNTFVQTGGQLFGDPSIVYF